MRVVILPFAKLADVSLPAEITGPRDVGRNSPVHPLANPFSRCREMHSWSAFEDFLEDLKPILQALVCRHGRQADAYGDWDVVAIDRKGRRG